MPVNLQHLQSLLGVSSLSDVKINDSGKLEKRSGIRALFARIGEFFQSLSAGGRAAIAARNEAVVSAMRQAVNEARTDAQPQAQQISRRLATVTDSLATAMKENRSAAKKDVISKLHDDQRFKALPLRSRQTLERTLTDIADNMPVSDWKTHMDTVKNYFFLPLPPGADIDAGLQIFQNTSIQYFLQPSTQEKVQEDGIHTSFTGDAPRNGMTITGADLQKWQSPEVYATALKNFVGEEHRQLLPFISLMATQNGMDGMGEMLLIHMGITQKPASLIMADYGIMVMPNSERSLSLSREGNDLLISSRFHVRYTRLEELQQAQPSTDSALSFQGHVTMRVHLGSQPSEHTVNGKTVLVPQISMETDELHFTTP